ncbi:hypothetical protein LTR65_003399 [Meristemomyces frigidus]
MSISQSTNITTAKPCRLLALPPELRICIYDYVFLDDSPSDIDIFAARLHAPTSALVGTCHQIQKEAEGIYQQELTRFWRTHSFHFYMSLVEASRSLRCLETYTRAPHPQLQRLVLTFGCGAPAFSDRLVSLVNKGNGKVVVQAQAPSGFTCAVAFLLRDIATEEGYGISCSADQDSLDVTGVARVLSRAFNRPRYLQAA